MVTTVKLDKELENHLLNLTKKLNKKKSEIIKDAINYYAIMIEKNKKIKIKNAVSKTKNADIEIFKDYEDTLDDAL